jgi:hypothetical protein
MTSALLSYEAEAGSGPVEKVGAREEGGGSVYKQYKNLTAESQLVARSLKALL